MKWLKLLNPWRHRRLSRAHQHLARFLVECQRSQGGGRQLDPETIAYVIRDNIKILRGEK